MECFFCGGLSFSHLGNPFNLHSDRFMESANQPERVPHWGKKCAEVTVSPDVAFQAVASAVAGSQRIAVAGVGEQFNKAWPIHDAARPDISEYFDGSGFGQSHGLAGDILITRGDAGVAQNTCHHVSQTVVLWT